MMQALIALIWGITLFLPQSDKIEKVYEINLGEGYKILGISVDLNGNIYISEKFECAIIKFDKFGKFIKKVGKRGEGPGEFRTYPGKIAVCGDVVAVTDATLPFIHLFTQDLKYIKTLKTPMPVADLSADGTFIYASTLNYSLMSPEVIIYDTDGNVVKTIISKDGELNPFLLSLTEFDVFFDNLILVYPALNRIEVINSSSGTLIKRFSVNELPPKPRFLEGPKIYSFIEVPENFIFRDVSIDKKSGYIFILGGEYSKNANRDIYVFDKTYKLVKTLTLPEKAKLIYIDKSGSLYAVINGKIIKYKVKL